MASNAGKTIAMVGVVGAGGYVAYRYMRYSRALDLLTAADRSAVENSLPFLSYLMAGFSEPMPGTPAGNAYHLLEANLADPPVMVDPGVPPGSTPSGPTDTTVIPGPGPAPPATMPQPTAADLQKSINLSVALPDQWNWAYRQLTGYGIDQLYGGNFDEMYGSMENRFAISADAFLSLPAARGLVRRSSISGLGAIARFYTPVINPMGSMVYRSQHPSPYRFPIGGMSGGMGAFTQASGFEKALYAGAFLSSPRTL